MITIVDYGVGNIRAFLNVYRRLNIKAQTGATPDDLGRATHIVLPGVGDFDETMRRLQHSGMREALDTLVMGRGVPVLGVCVGMQMLGRTSEEGVLEGLGWIDGDVKSFRSSPDAAMLPFPHMGWNDVHPSEGSALFANLDSGARFYFLHSYYFRCDEASTSSATSVYGVEFTCAVNQSNVFGVQFHPEKSHHWGTQLLQNFATI